MHQLILRNTPLHAKISHCISVPRNDEEIHCSYRNHRQRLGVSLYDITHKLEHTLNGLVTNDRKLRPNPVQKVPHVSSGR